VFYYVDNSVSSLTYSQGTVSSTTNVLEFGNPNTLGAGASTAEALAGNMSYAGIYNRVLNASEIQFVYKRRDASDSQK
jgi:hypothetical protein